MNPFLKAEKKQNERWCKLKTVTTNVLNSEYQNKVKNERFIIADKNIEKETTNSFKSEKPKRKEYHSFLHFTDNETKNIPSKPKEIDIENMDNDALNEEFPALC